MAAAALAGTAFVFARGIPRRYYEWRIRWLEARGEDAAYEQWALTRYNPDGLIDKERRAQPAQAVGAAVYMAISVWTWRELDPELGQALTHGAVVVVALVMLLRNFRKTDEELGLDASGRNPMRGPPTFLERHERHIKKLALGILALAAAVPIFGKNGLSGRLPGWMDYAAMAIVGGALITLGALYLRDLRSDGVKRRTVTIPRDAVVGALAAIGIVAFVLGVAIWLL